MLYDQIMPKMKELGFAGPNFDHEAYATLLYPSQASVRVERCAVAMKLGYHLRSEERSEAGKQWFEFRLVELEGSIILFRLVSPPMSGGQKESEQWRLLMHEEIFATDMRKRVLAALFTCSPEETVNRWLASIPQTELQDPNSSTVLQWINDRLEGFATLPRFR